MNLYKYHNQPEELHNHEGGQMVAFQLFMDERHKTYSKADTPFNMSIILRSPDYALAYAQFIDNKFPAGEDAIARDAWTSYAYAMVLKSRFEKGERAINRNPRYKEAYEDMLKFT